MKTLWAIFRIPLLILAVWIASGVVFNYYHECKCPPVHQESPK